jgi:hypothetical protein
MTVSPLISDVHAALSLASSARIRDRVGQDETRVRFSSAMFLPPYVRRSIAVTNREDGEYLVSLTLFKAHRV